MSDRATDEELVQKAVQASEGDYRAFNQLVGRHMQHVAANCRYITREPADAEDLAQEVFVKAFFGLPSFEGRASFRTWIQRIKVNHCLNHVKKKEGKKFVELDDELLERSESMAVDPEAEVRGRAEDARRSVAEVLDLLGDTLRIPLVMRDMDQLSYQEIADTLGIGLSATKMRIKRARAEFRRRYRGRHEATAEP